MSRTEQYLVRQVELERRYAAQQDSERPRPDDYRDLQNVALRDAYETFSTTLHSILRGREQSSSDQKDHLKIYPAANPRDFEGSPVSHVHSGYFTATVVGSSQLGKSTMLNSLLKLFSYDLGNERVLSDDDILPTHDKHLAGLPFPLRIEYHSSFQIRTTRWSKEELEDLMQIVANEALTNDAQVFQQSNFQELEEDSFMQFLSDHGRVDEDGIFQCNTSAAATLQADGGEDKTDFPRNMCLSAVIKSVREHLLMILQTPWFRYKSVTLGCPSRLLKAMRSENQESVPCILDLPGVYIVNDNNFLVEELVRRNVAAADTIIVLTGQRSFTEDVIKVLRASVFERIMDLDVTPPPTVAVTNSHVLKGLQKEELDTWKRNVLHGDLGWYTELAEFATENFSSRRRHRLFGDIEPSLFPNDLSGFMNGGAEARDVGVGTLVGYFMHLPQQVYLAGVSDVLERANAYRSALDQLSQVPMLAQKQAKGSSQRLFKLTFTHRMETYEFSLNSRFAGAMQSKMFNWEHPRSLQEQLDQIDTVTNSELENLYKKFVVVLKQRDSLDIHRQIASLVRHLLLEVTTDWDSVTGRVVFKDFLNAVKDLTPKLYSEWVPQLFDEGSSDSDRKTENVKAALLNALQEKVSKMISNAAINYTFTNAYRQRVWNLDVTKALNLPRFRRGQFVGVTERKVWADIESLVRKKISELHEHVYKNVRLESAAVKQVVSRVKVLITETFTQSAENFAAVASALENITHGGSSVNQTPVVLLREELLHFTSQLNEYLEKHKKLRNQFGGEELKKLLQARSRSRDNDRPERSCIRRRTL